MYRIIPLKLKQANKFIIDHHRHHNKVQGHKFSIGLHVNDKLVGVAVCGRPVARKLDDGNTIEINRLATDGTKNACSKLYAFSAKYAKHRGFKRIITYTLVTEIGSSLRAANYTLDAKNVGAIAWTSKRSKKNKSKGIVSAPVLKNRWIYYLN